jgi:hypothetical protein
LGAELKGENERKKVLQKRRTGEGFFAEKAAENSRLLALKRRGGAGGRGTAGQGVGSKLAKNSADAV